jgi:hypothetical protein
MIERTTQLPLSPLQLSSDIAWHRSHPDLHRAYVALRHDVTGLSVVLSDEPSDDPRDERLNRLTNDTDSSEVADYVTSLTTGDITEATRPVVGSVVREARTGRMGRVQYATPLNRHQQLATVAWVDGQLTVHPQSDLIVHLGMRRYQEASR